MPNSEKVWSCPTALWRAPLSFIRDGVDFWTRCCLCCGVRYCYLMVGAYAFGSAMIASLVASELASNRPWDAALYALASVCSLIILTGAARALWVFEFFDLAGFKLSETA